MFDPGDDPGDIVNLVTGKVATHNVNVDKQVDVGLSQTHSFKKKQWLFTIKSHILGTTAVIQKHQHR